jgi:hypothetical protein
MAEQRIDVTARSAADPQSVYRLLTDGSTWPRWSPIKSFQLVQPGPQEPESVGAIRLFVSGRTHSRERIAELIPGRRFSYELLSGMAIRDYRADVDLEPAPDGTVIHWRSRFRASVPGTGGLYRRALHVFIQRCADGLAAYAAR